MDHDLYVTIDQVHWSFLPIISLNKPYEPTISGMSQGCLRWSLTILLLSLDSLFLPKSNFFLCLVTLVAIQFKFCLSLHILSPSLNHSTKPQGLFWVIFMHC